MMTMGTSTAAVGVGRIEENIARLAAEWSQQRSERQRRRELDPTDFDRLRDAGFLLASLPTDEGGLWESHARSSRFIFELLRTLAHGDSSVALVAAMHPLVLSTAGWLGWAAAPPPFDEPWRSQRRWVFQTVREGAWWGTIQSEPGSGGDLSATRATARPVRGEAGGLEYLISGQKHFGSGSGMTSYMITAAIPAGEAELDVFFMDVRGVPWDGSAGVKLVAAWDGHGMTATQSHALEFGAFPATRLAWPVESRKLAPASGGLGGVFAAVTVGVVEIAVETARGYLERRRLPLRPFEQVEWSRVEVEAWLIQQAYAGILRAVEQHVDEDRAGLLGKTAIAELAESLLTRICRVVGGSAYSRHSPFGFWFEDVRALGFLRPPWSLAYDRIFAEARSG